MTETRADTRTDTNQLWNDWNSSGGPKYPHEKAVQFTFRSFPADKRKGTRALDAGCGSGVNTAFLAREGFDVTSFDISDVGVDNTRARLTTEGLRAEVFVSALDTVTLPAEAFDVAICVGVLDSAGLIVAGEGVRRVASALKRGGRGVFVFASDRDYRLVHAAKWRLHGFTRAEVEATFAPCFAEVAYDRFISTYKNGAEEQNDWLITVTK